MSLLNINSKQYTKLLNLHTFPTRRSSDLRSTGRINNKRNGNVQPRLFFRKTNESIKQKGEEMKEKIDKKNGIRLLTERLGGEKDPAILLIAGAAVAMLYGHAEFRQKLSEKGFLVTRYENRDV